MMLVAIAVVGEIILMAAGLKKQKGGVKADRDNAQDQLPRCRWMLSVRACKKCRHHQAQGRQRHDDAEIGVGALQVMLLFRSPPRTQQ